MTPQQKMKSWWEVANAKLLANARKYHCEGYEMRFELFLTGHHSALLKEDALLEALSKDDRFPVVVDCGLTAVLDDLLVIAVMPSGHDWVSTGKDTWGGDGDGPFKVVPWSLPSSLILDSEPISGAFIEHGRVLAQKLIRPK